MILAETYLRNGGPLVGLLILAALVLIFWICRKIKILWTPGQNESEQTSDSDNDDELMLAIRNETDQADGVLPQLRVASGDDVSTLCLVPDADGGLMIVDKSGDANDPLSTVNSDCSSVLVMPDFLQGVSGDSDLSGHIES